MYICTIYRSSSIFRTVFRYTIFRTLPYSGHYHIQDDVDFYKSMCLDIWFSIDLRRLIINKYSLNHFFSWMIIIPILRKKRPEYGHIHLYRGGSVLNMATSSLCRTFHMNSLFSLRLLNVQYNINWDQPQALKARMQYLGTSCCDPPSPVSWIWKTSSWGCPEYGRWPVYWIRKYPWTELCESYCIVLT